MSSEEENLEEIFKKILGKNVNKPLLKRCIKLYLTVTSYAGFRGQLHSKNIPLDISEKIKNALFNDDGTKKDLQTVLVELDNPEQVEIIRKQLLQETLNIAIDRANIAEVGNTLRKGASAKNVTIGGIKYIPLIEAVNKLSKFDILTNDKLKDIITLLLEKGADPNIETTLGSTPLITAASKGNVEIVKILLYFGADPKYRTRSGTTVMNVLFPHEPNAEKIKDIIEQFPFYSTMGVLRERFNNADFEMDPDLRLDFIDYSGIKRKRDDEMPLPDQDQEPPDDPEPPLGGGFNLGGRKRSSRKQKSLSHKQKKLMKRRKTRKQK